MTTVTSMSVSRELRRVLSRRFVQWMLYLIFSWLLLRPILVTSVVTDDFMIPFDHFRRAGLSPWKILTESWDATRVLGHINFLGQAIGGFILTAWTLLMGGLGIRYSTIYATYKFFTFIAVAISVSYFIRRASSALLSDVGTWRVRVVVSVLLFGSLQLHVPWSHDPVASYPTSGYTSAAIGFVILALAVDALRSPTRSALVGSLVALAVWYYEINIALIPALAPIVVGCWLRLDKEQRTFRRLVTGTGLTMFLPLALVAVSYPLIGPETGQYAGTEVSSGSAAVSTTLQNLVSSLPGAAWPLSADQLQHSFRLYPTPLVILMALALVLVGLSRLHPRQLPASPRGSQRLHMGLLTASALAYMITATAFQSSTAKIQAESVQIGYVYNYYAIGSTALAAIAALLVLTFLSLRSRPLLTVLVSSVIGVFICVQLMVNWNLTVAHYRGTWSGRNLLVAFTEDASASSRCIHLRMWANLPPGTEFKWSDSYESRMLAGLHSTYLHFHGEPFCAELQPPP